MRHFDSDVFDTTETSYLYRFISALCGNAGAGDLKRSIFEQRLMTNINTISFRDLDRLFDGAFGLPRFVDESYAFDPDNELLTSDEWDEVFAKDALYRERLTKIFAAMGAGGTNEGLRLAVEAVYGGDCKLLEVWKFLDLYGLGSTSQSPNLLLKGSFEHPLDVAGWDGVGCTLVPSSTREDRAILPVYAGSGSAMAVPYGSATSAELTSLETPVSQGSLYSGSVAVNLLEDFQISLILEFTDGKGNVLGQSSTETLSIPTQQWALLKVEGVTATSGFARLKIKKDQNSRFMIDEAAICHGNRAFDAQIDNNVRLGRNGGNYRNEVVVCPIVSEPMSDQEFTSRKTRLTHFLDRVRPQDSIVTVDFSGLQQSTPLMTRAIGSDSSYFEVQKYVTEVPDIESLPNSQYTTDDVIRDAQWWAGAEDDPAPAEKYGTTMESSVFFVNKEGQDNPIKSTKYLIRGANGTNYYEAEPYLVKVSENESRVFSPRDAVANTVPISESQINLGVRWSPNRRMT